MASSIVDKISASQIEEAQKISASCTEDCDVEVTEGLSVFAQLQATGVANYFRLPQESSVTRLIDEQTINLSNAIAGAYNYTPNCTTAACIEATPPVIFQKAALTSAIDVPLKLDKEYMIGITLVGITIILSFLIMMGFLTKSLIEYY